MRRVYIVLSTSGVGGAEKRFTDHWFNMIQLGLDVHLVLDRRTHSLLAEQDGYASKLAYHPNLHVLDFAGAGYTEYCLAVWKFFRGQPKGGLLHFPLAYIPGLCTRFRHNLIVSWVNNTLPSIAINKWKHSLCAWLGLATAGHIDFLNPSNANKFRKLFFWKKNISITLGGAIIEPERCQVEKKKNKFVYIGRLVEGKQPLRLANILPEVHHRLAKKGFKDYSFAILGDGPQATELHHLIGSSRFHSVPLRIGYSKDPLNELKDALAFFSVQYTSNYPSRSLAEAMACGTYPIVTDVGETRAMTGIISQSIYIKRDFTATEITEAISSLLKKNKSVIQAETLKISRQAKSLFSPSNQTKYFIDLYEKLSH